MSLLIITAISLKLILSSSANSDEEEEHGKKMLQKTLKITIKRMIEIHTAIHKEILTSRGTNNYHDYFVFQSEYLCILFLILNVITNFFKCIFTLKFTSETFVTKTVRKWKSIIFCL